MDKLIKQLAQERVKAFDAKVITDQMIAKIKASDEYQQAELAYKDAQVEIGNLELDIKNDALVQFGKDGNKHPNAAIEIEEFPVVETDRSDDFLWGYCLDHMHKALDLNKKKFDAAVIAGLIPKYIAFVKKEPRAQIKTDLSDWL